MNKAKLIQHKKKQIFQLTQALIKKLKVRDEIRRQNLKKERQSIQDSINKLLGETK
tara:strand:- start:1099 stop:1266 length:168 start_codon:yes stop_codon:yes gene_type:complete